MKISSKQDFIKALQSLDIKTDNVVVKPNWVVSDYGAYTEAEILDWTLESFVDKTKIVIESYTPWRGLQYIPKSSGDELAVDLIGGKKYWDFYKEMDRQFLQVIGADKILAKHNASYINITDAVWSGNCVDPDTIKQLVAARGLNIYWQEFYSYIPNSLFSIRENATLISLAKIKTEEDLPMIGISMSVKNLFGLIPHPSRMSPFHDNGHVKVPQTIADIYNVYTSVFPSTAWIDEGIFTMIRKYTGPEEEIQKNQKLLFVGKSGKEVDLEACKALGFDSESVEHLRMIE